MPQPIRTRPSDTTPAKMQKLGFELDVFAKLLNPKLRGWINYYGKFYRRQMLELFFYVNERVKKWIANKYKLRSKSLITAKYQAIQTEQPELFYHWRLGIKA